MNETLTRPVAERTELEQHFHDELADGKLVFQRSAVNAWLPPRSEDPVSLSTEWEWVEASGAATLVSWVTYRRAYHPFFEDKIPYQVAVVELAEGPRMIAPLELGDRTPGIDLALRVDIRHDGGEWIPVFVPAGSS
ncbi:OB-fold domain-containing protein [Streptomyces sp. NPDC094034]|uniref:Zn-ribbon domain-containing OB-fold protein n=1 Tax=Streptomyces sp. NPDC094034 TaxID=3155309 RepID=UPI00331A5349